MCIYVGLNEEGAYQNLITFILIPPKKRYPLSVVTNNTSSVFSTKKPYLWENLDVLIFSRIRFLLIAFHFQYKAVYLFSKEILYNLYIIHSVYILNINEKKSSLYSESCYKNTLNLIILVYTILYIFPRESLCFILKIGSAVSLKAEVYLCEGGMTDRRWWL